MNVIFIAVGILSQKTYAAGPSHILGLGKALLAKGCRLTVLTSRAGEKQLRHFGLKAEYWLVNDREQATEPGLVRIPFIMIKRMLQAGFMLRRQKFPENTVIFVPSSLLWEVFPLLLVKGKPVIRIPTFHMGYPNPFRGYRGAFTTRKKFPSPRETLAYFQYKLSLPCIKYGSDVIIAHTNMSHFLRDIGIPAEKIVGMDVGVDWDSINAVAAGEKKYDACWVGRYNPQKGCDDLLEIWETVSRADGTARMAVMGNVESQLRTPAEQKHLAANIEFCGPVNEDEKYRVMKESSLFLFPSYFEAVPLSVIEAMACGLPVIAYDLPVYKSHFPGGMVRVPIGDKEAFAREVISLRQDRSRKERLAADAASVASRYRWENAAERLLVEAERIKNQSFTA